MHARFTWASSIITWERLPFAGQNCEQESSPWTTHREKQQAARISYFIVQPTCLYISSSGLKTSKLRHPVGTHRPIPKAMSVSEAKKGHWLDRADRKQEEVSSYSSFRCPLFLNGPRLQYRDCNITTGRSTGKLTWPLITVVATVTTPHSWHSPSRVTVSRCQMSFPCALSNHTAHCIKGHDVVLFCCYSVASWTWNLLQQHWEWIKVGHLCNSCLDCKFLCQL